MFDYSTLFIKWFPLIPLLHVVDTKVVTRCQTYTLWCIWSVCKFFLDLIKLWMSAGSVYNLDIFGREVCLFHDFSIVIKPSEGRTEQWQSFTCASGALQKSMLFLIQRFDYMLHVDLLLWIGLIIWEIDVDVFNRGELHVVRSASIYYWKRYLSNLGLDLLLRLFFFCRIHNLEIILNEFRSKVISFHFWIRPYLRSVDKWLGIKSKFSFFRRLIVICLYVLLGPTRLGSKLREKKFFRHFMF